MIEALRELHRAEPFRPFDVVLDDGRRIRVKDPLHVGWNRRVFAVSLKGDTAEVIELARIQKVEPSRSATARKNGGRRRGK